jgi:protocatechuate 3,4-dioxygenase beta subunit
MTITRRVLPIVLLGIGFAVDGPRAQQAPPAATGFISGQVVEGGSTRPVPGATATLTFVTPRGPARQIIADGRGRYVFSGLAAGEFRLTADKTGWRTGAFGLDRPAGGLAPSGEVLTLAPGGRATATVPVWRPALISGRVTDDAGQPLAAARVAAMQWAATRGRRNLVQVNTAVTDDRGQFTLSVQPGEYMIAAISDQVRNLRGRSHVFRQTFYPRSPATTGSTTVTVRSGDERNGIDIQLPLEPAVRVTGVLNRTDAGAMPQRLEALRFDSDVPRQFAARPVDAQGRFAFENLPAGRYVLQTPLLSLGNQDPSRSQELWARVLLDVADRDLDLAVDLRRPLLVSGRVSFDGSTPVSAGGVSIGVRLFREEDLPLTDVIPGNVPVGPDGRFTLAVTPGRYVISSGVAVQSIQDLRNEPSPVSVAARSWSLRTGTYAGRDAADIPIAVTGDISNLDLTFTDRSPVLRGRVSSRQGSIEAAQLLAFPADESLWSEFAVGRRFLGRRLPADGSFELRNLPEGIYFLAAVRSMPQDYEAWRNPAFLERVARDARRVTLLEGQTTTQDIELVAAPAVSAATAPLPVVFEPTDRAIVRERAANPSGATISGVVVAAGSNAPIGGARVGLTQAATAGASIGGTYTDEQGRFVLAEVPEGQHTLYVSQPSFVSTTVGALRPGDQGTPVTVTNGQQMSGLAIAMIKGAAVGGTVVDQNGQPLPNVPVTVRAYRWTARGRELLTARPTAVGATTNQRGEYRTSALAPGDYIVQAAPQDSGSGSAIPVTTQADVDAAARQTSAGTAAAVPPVEVMLAPMYYPNTPDASAAQAVRIEAGDERTIDFQLRLMPTATISGVVRTPDGSPSNRLGLTLTASDPLTQAASRSRSASTDANGAFTIRGILPGRYMLTTSGATTRSIAPTRTFTGALELFVDRDMTGVVLDLVPMATVSGRVHGEVTATLRQPTVRISLAPLPGTVVPPNLARSAPIAADNSFSIPNVPAGRYRFEMTGPNNIVKPRVASQLVKGIDTSDAGLEVRGGDAISVDVELTASEARVSGLLRDRAGQPVVQASVVLFASDAQLRTPPSRRIFGIRPDQNGRYAFPDVPAGDYLITAVADIEPGEWFNPAVLARLAPGAAPVSVRRGDALEIIVETR